MTDNMVLFGSSLTELDVSNETFINDKWIVREASRVIIESTIFLPVVLFGIFGNVLSIYILIKNRHIRTPTNLLIGNMAIADLLALLIHPWVFLSYDLFQNYELGEIGCKTEAAIECSLLIASVISLSAISYDRLTAIVLPQETRLSKKGAKIVMMMTWFSGVAISTPLFFFRTYKERKWKDFLEKFCYEKALIINIYWLVIVTVLVWLPLTIQLICYISIYITLHRYEIAFLKRMDNHQMNYKKKAIKMMFAVILTFMICRLPFTGLIFYRRDLYQKISSSDNTQVQYQVSGWYHTLWIGSKYLIFVNAALNPLIYGLTNEKFRKGFKTTKVSKWLFTDRVQIREPPIAETKKDQPKTVETTVNRNIFVILKFKPKSVSYNLQDTTAPIDNGRNGSSVKILNQDQI